MQEVAGTKPAVTKGRRSYEASKLRQTWRYYATAASYTPKIFPISTTPTSAQYLQRRPGGESAAKMMRKHRAALIGSIAMDRPTQIHCEHAGPAADPAL
jgi:hypothetical protein